MSRHPVETPCLPNSRAFLTMNASASASLTSSTHRSPMSMSMISMLWTQPLGKVVRLAQREAHAMDANSVVLDVVPHTGPLHVAAIARRQDAGTASIWGLSLN